MVDSWRYSKFFQIVFPIGIRNGIKSTRFSFGLTVLRQGVFDKLAAQRIERRAGLSVHIDIKVSRERVFTRISRFSGYVGAGAPLGNGERNRSHARLL
jgi:hypothetical protein